MGHYVLIYLVFLASFGLIGADTPPTATTVHPSDFTKRSHFQETNEVGVTDTRFVTSNSTLDKERSEERGGGFSVVEKLKSVFTKGVPEKLQKWLEKETPVDNVFKYLHLDTHGFLFDKPHFAAWVQYTSTMSVKFPEMSAISSLTTRYGDAMVYEMIQVAKGRLPTQALARELETKQMQHWLATGKDPDELFHIFKLHWNGGRFFENPQFITWAKYVDDLNTKNLEEPIWMYSTLAKYFNDEVLFKLTNSAKKLEKTKAMATKVETDWFQANLQDHKTPSEAFLSFGLGKTPKNLLENVVSESGLVGTWVKYMEAFNERYSEKKTTMIETFTKAFGDDGVTKMLHDAKSESWTRDLATKMESAQLKFWLDSKKTTDDVFNLLHLDKEVIVYRFTDEPLFATWVSYINTYVMANPEKKVAVFSDLQSTFNNKALNKVLNEAKKYSSMESTAIKIQMDRIQSYLANNQSPRYVFTALGLRDDGDGFLGTSLFNAWMNYVDSFNRRNPSQHENWFYVLRAESEYGGVETIKMAMKNPSTVELGKKLEREWLNYWLDTKSLPEHVFRFLHLNRAGESALVDPNFKRWTTYLNAFNQKYPEKQTTMIEGFKANYHYNALMEIFEKAKKDPTTQKLAIKLEKELIKMDNP